MVQYHLQLIKVKQLINEAKINKLLLIKLIDADANEQITDDFFTFT
jgi:hypothetical protein